MSAFQSLFYKLACNPTEMSIFFACSRGDFEKIPSQNIAYVKRPFKARFFQNHLVIFLVIRFLFDENLSLDLYKSVHKKNFGREYIAGNIYVNMLLYS